MGTADPRGGGKDRHVNGSIWIDLGRVRINEKYVSVN